MMCPKDGAGFSFDVSVQSTLKRIEPQMRSDVTVRGWECKISGGLLLLKSTGAGSLEASST